MSRQTKYPPIFSACLVIARSSDSHILVSDTGFVSAPIGRAPEFPRDLFVDVLELPIDASLNKRPTQETLLDAAGSKLASISREPSHVATNPSISYLGLYESPNWGISLHYIKYYMLAVVGDNDLVVPKGHEWKEPRELMDNYAAFKIRLPPPTLEITSSLASCPLDRASPLDNDTLAHSSSYWKSLAQDMESEQWGAHTKIELSPGVECIPIRSNTLFPFHATNLITIGDGSSLMIVDPGANDEGKAHLEAVLRRLNPLDLHVFITHHHHDHIQSIDVIERLYPQAVVIGHPYTLDKTHTSLRKSPVCAQDSDEVYKVGSRSIQVISLPGHTRGHLALYEEKSKILVSGDHTVGFGSSVLDPDGGGNMTAYLASTERLLRLDIEVILPCHGVPTLSKPRYLLETYISHRLEREKALLEAWNSGVHCVETLVRTVYTDVPEKLYPAANRNVILHLEKLETDGAIKLTPEVEATVREHQKASQ